MQINSFRHSGTTDSNATQREHDNRMIARKAAREGIVLLQNDGNVLPLLRGSMIALFGSGAGRTIKGGTGSGDVNERENISIYQGLINAGFSVSSAEWIQDYNERYHFFQIDKFKPVFRSQ